MSLILRQIIGYQQGRKSAPTITDPLLKNQLDQANKDLNSILKKWKFGDTPITTSQEFLAQFEPWINTQLEKQKELKVFLAKKGVSSLAELTSLPTSESEQLKFYKDNIRTKEAIINDYKEQEQTWNNTEQDYLKKIGELRDEIANLQTRTEEDQEDLITERDELRRDKTTLEQQVLALNNQLRNKAQEVTSKEQSIERIKKEKDQQRNLLK